MRFRLLGVSALGLILAVAVAVASATGGSRPATPAASGAGVQGQAKVFKSQSPAATLFDNNNNDSGIGISSQNFEPGNDPFDDNAADDFAVPATKTWTVNEVDVTGVYFNGSGPAVSENVTFYTSKNGLPKKIKKQYLNLPGIDNGSGSFIIAVPNTKLKGGASGKTYWVSVQINMDFNVGGQWGWEGSLNSPGNLDAWQNPNNGFGTGCITYKQEYSCIGNVGQGDSKMFTIKGTQTP